MGLDLKRPFPTKNSPSLVTIEKHTCLKILISLHHFFWWSHVFIDFLYLVKISSVGKRLARAIEPDPSPMISYALWFGGTPRGRSPSLFQCLPFFSISSCSVLRTWCPPNYDAITTNYNFCLNGQWSQVSRESWKRKKSFQGLSETRRFPLFFELFTSGFHF